MGWVVLHGRVVHVYVHGEVMLWVVGTYLLLSMADVVCLVCRSCGGVLSLYGVLECQLCCELLLLLNMARMGCLVCRIIIIGQCACKEFVVCAQLRKIAQDEARNCVKVLLCHSVS